MRRFQLGVLACGLPLLLVSLALIGCGGPDKDKATDKDKVSDTDKKEDPTKGKPTPVESKGTATLKGKVMVKGGLTDDIKKVLAEDFLKDLEAAKLDAAIQETCKKGDMKQYDWRISDDGGVANVFVWVAPPDKHFFKISDEQKKEFDGKEVVMDQPNCAFEPHCAWAFPQFPDPTDPANAKKAIKTGQKFVIKNSAPIAHNTKGGDGNKINFQDEVIAPMKEGKVSTREIPLVPSKDPIKIQCGIHGWMRGWVRAFDHPYVAITDKDGNYEIKNVPAGAEVNIVAWHESANYLKDAKGVKMELKADETKTQNFEIEAAKVKR
jgi:hypothetical protein